MESVIGLLRVRIIRGVNLAVRDTRGSDPYIVLSLGGQKLKTSTIKNNVNPEWNEDLTLTVSEPLQPIKLQIFDKDTFSSDDEMGDAEFDIHSFLAAVRMDLTGIPNGTTITTVKPSRENCLAVESPILKKDGKVVQDLVLRLRNVESGEVELQLSWVNIPGPHSGDAWLGFDFSTSSLCVTGWSG
ncbi:putative ADP-ribosylation factor GTPase-activating protein AGD11 [Dendrobium catenatum]|uniref:Putative ADP-ribosylation factor GTPase-activating protein AGD11 n=1 Tax=Dendrobium catenatum TaxID=906689 RepID=A0A2I0WES2_9ASPA|nr:putative ADP-ribosylation factor GTPase-activating protein AGD11 [Dendrobium catenatum]